MHVGRVRDIVSISRAVFGAQVRGCEGSPHGVSRTSLVATLVSGDAGEPHHPGGGRGSVGFGEHTPRLAGTL